MERVVKQKLHVPPLSDVASVLQQGLMQHFSFVDVQVVKCPNLTEKPFMLAAEGLCGNPTLADIGGVGYLVPLAQADKIYNLKEIAKVLRVPDAFMIGAGAGPRHIIGINCEMMANVKTGETEVNNTHIAKLDQNNSAVLMRLKDNTEFSLMSNLFVSEGKPGEVLRVIAKKRVSTNNFVSAMREILRDHYIDQPVGMGGVFVIKSGKAKLHIMPDYSTTPLQSDEEVNGWLKFFEMSAPLSCLSTFVSHDPGLDLRVEHTHCFSDHGEGGHYHEDTVPDEVEYEGYFNVANVIYRIDPPSKVD